MTGDEERDMVWDSDVDELVAPGTTVADDNARQRVVDADPSRFDEVQAEADAAAERGQR